MKQTMMANHTHLSIPSQHGQHIVFYHRGFQRDYDTVLIAPPAPRNVEIYDLTGKKVASHFFHGGTTQIPTQHLPKGTYWIVIHEYGKPPISKRIIK